MNEDARKQIEREIFRQRQLLEDYVERGATADVEKIRNDVQQLEARLHAGNRRRTSEQP